MLPLAERWRGRARTGEAIAELLLAQITIRTLPVRRWRARFGLADDHLAQACDAGATLPRHIERGANRLPFASRCLPRALALSRMLRRRRIGHRLVIAARPAGHGEEPRELHAWIEQGGEVLLGYQPGPWIPVLSLP